ncbi:MAG: (Fe-S)-binding protein, partial [Ktedonobacterales bacterium]
PGVPARGRVALFAGCVMSTVFAETDRATIRVLAANGYEVIVPEGQGCCGALAVHAGEMARARTVARQNIAAFEDGGAEYVIANAAGCGAELKEYGRLFADDAAWAARARAFAGRTRDITELLGALLARGELNTRFARLPLRVTYQEPCHLAHAQRISRQPRALLEAIPGVALVEMEEPALCCGSAGIYNITRPEMANRLGDRKARHVAASGAAAVVTANPGCALQLRAALGRAGARTRVYHIVDVLDAAYRGRNLE